MWMEAAVAKYGRGNFRWVAMVGDLSAMYDEIDPVLACEMTQEAVGNLPRWTGGRRRDFVNMTHAGGQVQWGKANRDSRLTVDLKQLRLMQMARFDCQHTLYKFRGKVNRRKFGVPMGGFMSPGWQSLHFRWWRPRWSLDQSLQVEWFATWMMCLACMQ